MAEQPEVFKRERDRKRQKDRMRKRTWNMM
jgi:hypothetical protein